MTTWSPAGGNYPAYGVQATPSYAQPQQQSQGWVQPRTAISPIGLQNTVNNGMLGNARNSLIQQGVIDPSAQYQSNWMPQASSAANGPQMDTTSFMPSIDQIQPITANTPNAVNDSSQVSSFNSNSANPSASSPAQWDGYGSQQYNQNLLMEQNDLAGMQGAGQGGFNWDSSNINPGNWTMEGVGQGIGLGMSAFNAYTGYQQLRLGQDQLDFQKGAWEKDYAQRKDAYDYNKAKDESKWAALGDGGS